MLRLFDREEAQVPVLENIPTRPKLILLNLKMPSADGLDVLQKLKSDARIRELPVVMLTSCCFLPCGTTEIRQVISRVSGNRVQ